MPEKKLKDFMQCFAALEKIYDVVRIVDPVEKKVVYFNKENAKNFLEEIPCFDFWENSKVCDNCISLRAFLQQDTFVKFEVANNRIYMITASPIGGKECSYVVEMLNDITDKSVLESVIGHTQENFSTVILRINEAFVKDDLTTLFNRRFINERLPVEIATNTAAGITACLLMLDLDDFKLINDNAGHLAGDTVLKQFSELLKKDIRGKKDWVARYGGDEFLIFLNDTSEEKAMKVTERIRKDVEKFEFKVKDKVFKVTCSIGVGCLKEDMDMEAWINAADKNLYAVKALGGNNVLGGEKTHQQ